MKFTEIQNEVVKRYRVKLNPDSDCWRRMHAHVKTRTVCKWHQRNSIKATFDLLHEIGHIETFKSGMRRCESEYQATQWAIDRCKEYGIQVPENILIDYQLYIDTERDRGVRRHSTTLPKLELLRLKA